MDHLRVFRKLAFIAFLALAVALVGCEGDDGSAGAPGEPGEPGFPPRPEATAFAGTDTCKGCHDTIHDSWMVTAHTMKLRPANEGNFVNDSDGSGRSDFFDAAPLSLNFPDSNFVQFGDAAPILGEDEDGPFFEISGTKYYIVYTLGGSGFDENGDGLVLNDESQWKQRYITKIGDSHYIGPVQFNGQTGEYVTYHPEDWWAVDGDLSPTGDPVTSRSYERRCAGCHVTGLQIALDEADEEWTMDFVDNRVACEACHGPGALHAAGPSLDNIVNPATLEATQDLNDDGTVDGVDDLIVRDNVCNRCHNRGSGFFSAFGSSTGYPSIADANGNLLTYQPGADEDLSTFFDSVDAANDPGRFWLNNDGSAIAGSSHRQQAIDLGFGPHAPDQTFDAVCFDCHDAHGPNRDMTKDEIVEDGIVVKTAVEDNTLCQACHAGHGPFAEIDPVDVNTESSALKGATVNHTTHIFDPEDSGASQCKACHMPETAKSGVRTGHDGIGDVPSHTFNIITPQQTIDTIGTESAEGVPNSCNAQGCHNNPFDVGTKEADYIAFLEGLQADFDAKFVTQDGISNEWLTSGHAHFDAEAFNHWNEDGEVEAECAKCHSSTGFREYAENGSVAAAQDLSTNIVDCRACHTEGGNSDFRGDASTLYDDVADFPELDPVEFPSGDTQTFSSSSNICMTCHQGRESGLSVTTAIAKSDFGFINRHYFAAAAILFGTEVQAGYEYDTESGGTLVYMGQNVWATAGTSHNGLTECVQCHLEGTNDHNFLPEIGDCNGCHQRVVDSFEQLGRAFGAAQVDYDGDGVGESFQGEIDGMEELLLAAIQDYAANTLTAPIIYSGDNYPYWFNDTNGNGLVDEGEASYGNRYTSFDATLLKAAFNYHSNQDPCGDIHNYRYVLQTSYDSIDHLNDGNLDGNVQGTSVAATRPTNP